MLEAAFRRELADVTGGRVIFIHAAAAIGPIGFAGEADPAAYRASVLLNAAAPLVLADAFLRAARNLSCSCQLVLLSSGAARRSYPGLAAYGAAKAAVDQWVRTVGNEQSLRGQVQVLSVTPGRVATAMHEQLRAASESQLPSRSEFIRQHEEGLLRDPRAVASQLWSLLNDGHVSSGQVLDLRDDPPA
jgi:NAD(P)-dependent dehydrogenase (short-subunit alcohol dehydrogenase family)